jgi:hypothetical protein
MLPFAELEAAYDLIAETVDAAGPAQERLFLAKLALALCHEIDDPERIRRAVALARRELGRD